MAYYTQRFNIGDWVVLADGYSFDNIENNREYYVGGTMIGTSGQLLVLYADSTKRVRVSGTRGNKSLYFKLASARAKNPYVGNIQANGGIANNEYRFQVVQTDEMKIVDEFRTIEDAEDFVKTALVDGEYNSLDIYQFIRRGKRPGDVTWEV